MIYITQGGRCGNQLFTYAFARQLQMSYPNEKITFDYTAIYSKVKNNPSENYWEDSLARFNVIPYETITNSNDIVSDYATTPQKAACFIWRVIEKILKNNFTDNAYTLRKGMFSVMSKIGIYYLRYGFAPFKLTKSKNKFVFGSFEDAQWFNDIRPFLIEEFTPRAPVQKENLNLFASICNSNSICVSLRKWSIDVHEQNNLTSREICNAEYYKKAIHIICERVEKPVFIVFSDDVIWAKNIIQKVAENATILSENGNDDVAEKLRLMYSCKHFILANSTFCWWAQYLCQNRQKIVISPDTWLGIWEKKHPLIQKEWILIDCGKGVE